MSVRAYAGTISLCVSVLLLGLVAALAGAKGAHAISSALLVVAFVLSLHVPQSWRNARARRKPSPAQAPRAFDTTDFPEQPRRGVR
ncbi:hypothetical protein [Xanthomonas arboricola]|uniref:hypothetical protein n=1 Tax=Xanthomonas arboricola TaxID=56448 RepID=UPI000E1F6E9D|nr:hypothetical protein [Xanthomonas arboricola]